LRTKAALGLSSIDTKPFSRATIFNFQNRIANYEEKTGINLLEKTFDNLTAKQLRRIVTIHQKYTTIIHQKYTGLCEQDSSALG
jgi:hypothetical protein